MDLGIQDKTALVCGSSQGLGRAIAQALAMEGVRLVINSRSADKLANVQADIVETTGANVASIAADLTDPEGINSLVAETEEAFGKIDVSHQYWGTTGRSIRIALTRSMETLDCSELRECRKSGAFCFAGYEGEQVGENRERDIDLC